MEYSKLVKACSKVLKYLSALSLFMMMCVLITAVILRELNRPLFGDYVIVQLLMVILVMCGLFYSQQDKEHISIGLIVDRLSPKLQKVSDFISYLLTFIVAVVIGTINFIVAIEKYEGMRLVEMLNIPIYPFLFIIAFGFWAWGLIALIQLLQLLWKGGNKKNAS